MLFWDRSAMHCISVLQAAEEEHRRLTDGGVMGPDVRYGLLHGRLSSEEKSAALEAFAAGDTNVLIATTVVEVTLLGCAGARLGYGLDEVCGRPCLSRFAPSSASKETNFKHGCCTVQPSKCDLNEIWAKCS